MPEQHDLERFIEAQEPIHETAYAELRGGRKRSHWMWFVFPQIAGLGSSAISRRFAIASRAEAEAYLRHPVLGERLKRCTEQVNRIEGRSAHDVFGSPDDLKFRSCMTLFAAVSAENSVFHAALAKYFAGAADPATKERL